MENSILLSIKKLIGIDSEYDVFDQDLIIHINTVLAILNQIGIGPENGFSITDDSSTWSDFIGNDTRLESVKSYVYMKVKLLFDPPNNSALIESTNKLLNELEWRLNITK